MPLLLRITRQYSDNGVHFQENLGEREIQQFLAQKMLKLNRVALTFGK